MNSSHLPPQPVQQARNAFQRWYFNWAEPHYLRMPAELQAQARSLDQFLYSRAGAGFWLGLLMGTGGAASGLHASGVGWLAAWLISLVLVIALLFVSLVAWLRPETVGRGSSWPKNLLLLFAGGNFGALIGWVTARLAKKGFGAWADLPQEVFKFAQVVVPAVLLLCVVLALMMWITASARRYRMQQELQRLRDAEDRERVLTDDARPALKAAHEALTTLESFTHIEIEAALRAALVEGLGLKPKVAFGPVRVAVSGRRISPPLFESIELLGRDRTLARLAAALV